MTPLESARPGPGRRFAAEVAPLLAGLGYVVAETDRGFDVRRDPTHVRWRSIDGDQEPATTTYHQVKVGGNGTFSVTERTRSVSTRTGGLALWGRASFSVGRFRAIRFRKTWALGGRATPSR